MKVLIIGANKEYSLEHFYYKNLKALDQDVDIFDSKKIIDNYRKLALNKILFRSGLKFIYNKINKQLLEYVYLNKPDVIIVFKGMEIKPSTVDKLKSEGIFMINYNPDHPFIFSGKGSGNKFVTKSFDKYNLHLTYAENIKTQIEDKCYIPCELLPFGYEFDDRDFELIAETEEIERICFIGHGDSLRADKIKLLIDNKLPVTVIGVSWGKFLSNSEYLEIIDEPIYGIDYYKMLRKYVVQLNLLRPHNKGNHNMRFFEAAISGSIMLVPLDSEVSKFFDITKSVYVYISDNDLIDKCKSILELNSRERQSRRNQFRNNVKDGKNSYLDRSKELIEILRKYIK